MNRCNKSLLLNRKQYALICFELFNFNSCISEFRAKTKPLLIPDSHQNLRVSGQLPPDKYPPDNYPPRTNTPRTFTPPPRNFSSTYLGILCTYILHILCKSRPDHNIPHGRGSGDSSTFSSANKTSLKSTLPKPELAILLNLSVADIRTAINGSRTSFRTTPTATLCSIFVGLPTTLACEEHFFSCFRLYATPKRLF